MGDKHGTGQLTARSFKSAFNQLTGGAVSDHEVNAMMKEMDPTGSGVVDIKSFSDWLYQGQAPSPKKASPKQAKSKAARDLNTAKEIEAAIARANAELEQKLKQVERERDAALIAHRGDLTPEQEAALAEANAAMEKKLAQVTAERDQAMASKQGLWQGDMTKDDEQKCKKELEQVTLERDALASGVSTN